MKSFLKKYFDQGRQEGEVRLLRKRFGDLPSWAEERLRRASSAMLETWSERILTASTLDEVFSEQNG